MKIFANKSIWKKLVLILLIITIFSFGVPKTVQADSDDGGIGGTLMKPICNLLVGIGDGVVNIIHRFVVDQETSLIRINLEEGKWGFFIKSLIIGLIMVAVSIGISFIPGLNVCYWGIIAGAATIAVGAIVTFASGDGIIASAAQYVRDGLGEDVNIPVYTVSPEEIFKGELPLFDVNFFDTSTDEEDEEESYVSLGYSLSGIVAKWYYILLRIGIVAMLSVLVYIGIRILISSAASDKAKYKQMLGDWLIGLILLFTLHYIMIFATKINDKLIELVENTGYRTYECVFAFDTSSDGNEIENMENGIKEAASEENEEADAIFDGSSDDGVTAYATAVANGEICALEWKESGTTYIMITTNMMGMIRVSCDYYQDDSEAFIGYTFMFVVLIIFTIMFAIIYFKRVILMAFLTIIAPLVAVTYPIDKANDGSAQGFNMWFREYMFNLLLQPMHLLLYVILIQSAIEIASENIIWCLVVMMFMTQGEQLLRRLFNFEKAETPGHLGSVMAAGAIMGGMQRMFSHKPKEMPGHSGNDSGKEINGGDNGKSSDGNKINYKDAFTGIPLKEDEDEKPGDEDEKPGDEDKKPGDEVKKLGDEDEKPGDEDENSKKLSRLRGVGNYVRGNARRKIGGATNGNKLFSKEGQKAIGKKALAATGKGVLKAAKGTAKFAAKAIPAVALGATGATIGIAAGVTTGDLGKVGQYGLAGATAAGAFGSKLGSNVAGKVSSAVSMSDTTKEEYKRAWQGEEEYQKKQIEKRQLQMKLDENNIARIKQKYKYSDDKEAEEKLNELVDYYQGTHDITSNIDEMIQMDRYADSLGLENKEKAREISSAAFMGGKVITERDTKKAVAQAQTRLGMDEKTAKAFVKQRDKQETWINTH